MKDGSIQPPTWAEALLRAALPSDTAGRSVKADLDQEFRGRVDSGSKHPRAWYAWEAIKLAAHYFVRTVSTMGRRRVGQADPGPPTRPVDPAGGPSLGERVRGLFRNVVLAFRQMRRAPGFAAVAIGTLGLGIGATVTIFSVVNAVLLEPLPYPEPDRLVAIYEWKQPREEDRKSVV